MQQKKYYNTLGLKRLLEWMSANNITTYRLMKLVKGYSQNVYPWVKGLKRPYKAYATKIARITGGYVPVASWSISEELSDSCKNSKQNTNTTKGSDHGSNS